MHSSVAQRFLTLCLGLSLVLPLSPSAAFEQVSQESQRAVILSDLSVAVDASATFRARVTLRDGPARERLVSLGVTATSIDGDEALVLADENQLETLARLNYHPRDVSALASLLAQDGVQAQAVTLAEVGALTAVDDDADGLTNTEESWWGTDALNPDSDGDGVQDGAEVEALLAWLHNERDSFPASGRPFLGWPDETHDADFDGVPDLAEIWVLGLSTNRESTDRDKFDDGQELFGLARWDWGALPRAEDTGYVFAEMPSWVEAPGDHPLVGAFPIPEVDVVPSSLQVETVTTVTTDHVITEGTEKTYSTATTEGASTGHANTRTWNEWQELSVAEAQVESQGVGVAGDAVDWTNYGFDAMTAIATLANPVAGKAVSLVRYPVVEGVKSITAEAARSSAWVDAQLDLSGTEIYFDGAQTLAGVTNCVVSASGTVPPSCRDRADGLGLASSFPSMNDGFGDVSRW